ncbi:GerMN domain-containing protein [Streptomyces sp. NPDC051907]|uniref:GerMN domain-containing protein n=1 Tax=Streptomyces sp. NPDC051907 TaxID=3155284 RepID=UPI00342019FD
MSTEKRRPPAAPRWNRLLALSAALVLAVTAAACADGRPSAPDAPASDVRAEAGPWTDAGSSLGGPGANGLEQKGSSGSTVPAARMPPLERTVGGGKRQLRTSVYFLHGEHMSPAPRQVTAPATADGALRALLAGPSRAERADERTTAIPAGTALNSVVVRRNLATVDLSERFDDGGDTSLRARVAQVVFTATRFPEIHKVRFALDGKPVSSLGGEGVALDKPVGRADFEDLTPQILVEGPLPGSEIGSPVRVWGSANTFEAAFNLKITDSAGRAAADALVTASSGSGTRGSFDVTLPYRAVRSGGGMLTAYYRSVEDARLVVVDTVPLTLNR